MPFEFDIGVVAATAYDADGFLTVQVSNYGEGTPDAGAPFGELQAHAGDMARPNDPGLDANGAIIVAQASQAIYWWDGPRQHSQPTQDPRVVANLPKLSKGSRAIFGGGPLTFFQPSFFLLDGDTGDVTLYVPYGFSNGVATKAHVASFSASGDNITIRHGEGAGLALTGSAAILNGPDGSTYLELQSGGAVVLNGNLQVTGSLGVQGMVLQGPAPTQPVLLATFLPSTQLLVTA